MNDFYTNLQTEANKTRMTREEKQRMRVALYNAIESQPVSVPQTLAQPVRVKSPYVFISFIHARVLVPLLVVLVVLVGGGTSYAAAAALPGDVLYPVKININESLAQALATTPQAKVAVHTTLAETRLQEAETLASQNKLTASTSAELAQNLSTHVEAAQTITNDIAAQDPDDAAQLSTDLDSSLSAHGAILSQIGDDSGNDQTKQDSQALALEVNSHVRSNGRVAFAKTAPVAPAAQVQTMSLSVSSGTADVASSTTASAIASTTPLVVVSASATIATSAPSSTPVTSKIKNNTKVIDQASSTLAQARKDFANLGTLDASTTAQIQDQLDTIGALIDHNTPDSVSRALNLVIKLDAYLKAGKKFNIRLLPALLSQNLGAAVILNGTGGEKGGGSDQDSSQQNNTSKGGKGNGGQKGSDN